MDKGATPSSGALPSFPGLDVLEEIGRGSMGRVYRARQDDGTEVAVKVLARELALEPRFAQRFRREAEITKRFVHPHAVETIEMVTADDGALYLVMELVDGEDLGIVLDHDDPLSAARIGAILGPALEALDAAHRSGIVHRDFKPENILVGTSVVKVCDFGVAKLLDPEGPVITVDGFVCGTPEYMAPEQARGEALDARVDVYAAGVVLYRCLAGRNPFVGRNAMLVLRQHLLDAPPPAATASRPLPRALVDVAMRALSKDRDARFATVREMREALDRAIASLGEAASSPLGSFTPDDPAPTTVTLPPPPAPRSSSHSSAPPKAPEKTPSSAPPIASPPPRATGIGAAAAIIVTIAAALYLFFMRG